MTQIALATLEALISLELMALATISQFKAKTYKTWQPLAMKWRLWVTDDSCTEHDTTFVFDLPTLPEKVQPEMFDSEYSFDLDDEQPVQLVLSNGDSINLGYCECMSNDEFVDLVASYVNPNEQFNLLPYSFESPVTLSDDKDYLMYWFEKYITDDYTILFDDWLKDQPICNGYQVAQQLTLFFYGFLQSVLTSSLDLLDRVIQIVYDIRSGIVGKYCDDAFVYLDIGETA